MARYRKIDPRIWGDDKFRSVSKPQPNAQSLWLYLLTGPHTNGCPGLYNIGMAALAENLGWSPELFRIPFQELLNKGMVKYDSEAHVILIPRALHYDPPDNPNVVKHWAKSYDEIPECGLKGEFYHILKQYLEGLEKRLQERFMIPFAEGYRDSLALTIPEPEPLPKPLPKPKEEEPNTKSEGSENPPSPTPKKKVQAFKKNPEIKVFLDFYFQAFKEKFQAEPIIEGGKDGSLLKSLLEKIPLWELKDLLTKFFESDDKWIHESGYTLGAFKSQIQKLRIDAPASMGKSIDAANMWLRKEEARDGQTRQKKISYRINKSQGEPSGHEPDPRGRGNQN